MNDDQRLKVQQNERNRVQLLAVHALGVAQLTRECAIQIHPQDEAFHDAAYAAGLLHDLGKYQPQWQRWAGEYQRLKSGEVPNRAIAHTDYDPRSDEDKEIALQATQNVGNRLNHSSTGAEFALNSRAYHVALVVGGHHAGLRNKTALDNQIRQDQPDLQAAVASANKLEELRGEVPGLRLAPPVLPRNDVFRLEMLIRLLFSCLIDADRQDSTGQCPSESPWDPSALLERVLNYVRSLEKKPFDPRVRRLRGEVLRCCLDRADDPPGLFSLTVPTGGGKTLASMAFALKHAAKHDLQRVIVVMPYTSIIEQNAAVYRDVFGDGVVLEHHSNVASESAVNEAEDRARLATENWDAPIIVTTSVRFFESLFASHPRDCRRVHRIARSVIVFDEVQTFPVHLLSAILSALKHVGYEDGFGSSIVLCTATQPALSKRSGFDIGLEATTEIIGTSREVNELFDQVRYRWSRTNPGSIPTFSWGEVASQMVEGARALAVLNIKAHARELFESLRQLCCERQLYLPLFHLSTAMCPAHRRSVLAQIKAIPPSEPCLLAATQCVEAGVDLDFPLVFRALGPIDSIAQAAGRCNREGLGNGRLIVFKPEEHRLPRGAYKRGSEVAQDMLDRRPDLDLHAPETYTRYFCSLYNVVGPSGWDEHGIQRLRANLDFGAVDRQFKLIDDDTDPVIVGYGGVEIFLDWLENHGPSKDLFRQLQPFTVNLYRQFAERQQGLIKVSPYGLKIWNPSYYDVNVGLITELSVDDTVV